jgi:hypothetical protein
MKIEIPIEQTYPPIKLGQAAAAAAAAPAVKEHPKPAPKPEGKSPAMAVTPAPPPANQLQELDVWYGGYAGRDMLAGFIICCVWTVLVTLYIAPLVDRLLAPNARLEFWADIGLVGSVWLFQLFRWAYRKLAYQMRITTRHFILQRGFLYHWEIRPLAQFSGVEVRQHLVERLLGIGRIQLAATAPATSLAVRGVARPEEVAKRIRQRMAGGEAAT